MNHNVVTDYTNFQKQDNVKVFVRLRPPQEKKERNHEPISETPSPPSSPNIFGSTSSKKQVQSEPSFEVPSDTKITLRKPGLHKKSKHAFAFDRVFDTGIEQEVVFKHVGVPLVDRVLKGFNACCFAYGQTGSGKTYTIFGESNVGPSRGLLPRMVEYLFERIQTLGSGSVKYKVEVSFLEMYCDQLRDLGSAVSEKVRLASGRKKSSRSGSGEKKVDRSNRRYSLASAALPSRTMSSPALSPQRRSTIMPGSDKKLSTSDWFALHKRFGFSDYRIHEDEKGNVFVKDAAVMEVRSSNEVQRVIQAGMKLRATHETKMNTVSSRSHTIMILKVKSKSLETNDETVGLLNVIDLAGSERIKKSESEGQRLTEALFINQSLSALGKVVMSLDPSTAAANETGGDNGTFVPYRDSKLTRLLQNSLGGNSYTTLLATIHPLDEHYEESLSTLHFGAHCRNVKNRPKVNYANGGKSRDGIASKKLLRKLRAEIALLKGTLTEMRQQHRAGLASIMADLGVQGQVLADGRVRLVDGRTLGTAIFAEKGDGSDSKDSSNAEKKNDPLAIVPDAAVSIPVRSAFKMTASYGGRGGIMGGSSPTNFSSALIDARIAPLQHKIKTFRRNNLKLRQEVEAVKRSKALADERAAARFASLREENQSLKLELKDVRSDFESRIEQSTAAFKARMRDLVKNQERFDRETKTSIVRVPARRRTEKKKRVLVATSPKPSAPTVAVKSAARLSTDADRRDPNVVRAFVADLKYRDELVKMGELAEQLIVALHRGRVVVDAENNDADARTPRVKRAGPIPDGATGTDAAAAAAAWMANVANFPRWHALQRRASSMTDDAPATSSEEPQMNSDVGSGHCGVVRKLQKKKSAQLAPDDQLRLVNRKYRSLRCAYDALLRRQQRRRGKKILARTGALASDAAEKRRMMLFSSSPTRERPRTAL